MATIFNAAARGPGSTIPLTSSRAGMLPVFSSRSLIHCNLAKGIASEGSTAPRRLTSSYR